MVILEGWVFLMSKVPLYSTPQNLKPHESSLHDFGDWAGEGLHHAYKGTSLVRNCFPLRPYSRPMPRALWWSGQLEVSYQRGTPVPAL